MPALPTVLVSLLLIACASGGADSASGVDPDPDPSLTPQEVVRLQVEALRANDEANTGIATAFRFASPANRAMTGPLARFTAMIRGGYADMLGFEVAEFGRMVFDGDEAAQRVTLVQPDGSRSTYVFALSRQSGGEYDGCWMTDAVVPVEPEDDGLIRT